MSEEVIVLAPNGRWSAREQTGVAAVNGFVFTYENQTRVPKATYQDPAGEVDNTNPVRLDSKGEANIYWDITDTFYTIEVYAANPTSPFIPGELLYSQDNYPFVNGSGGGNIVINSLANNLVRNSQFTRWGSDDYLLPLAQTPQDIYTVLGLSEVICDDFIFERNNTNASVQVSRGVFNTGQTEVPGSPVNFLHYECTNVGAGGENVKAVSQIYQSADACENTEVSVGIWAKSSTSSTLTMYLTQNFGTGGSPSAPVVTQFFSNALTTDWTQYTATITVPPTTGKSFGTNGDSYIKLSVGLPLNAIANLDIANAQFHNQNTLPPIPYNTINDQIKRLDSCVNQATFRTGDYLLSLKTAARPGWLLCNDETIGNYLSNASFTGNQYLQLYLQIWANIPNSYAPIYTSAGVVTTRGANALEDWNANKALNMTRVLGRVFGAVGQPSLSMSFTAAATPQTFTASTSTNVLTVASTANLPTGKTIVFTTTGALPAPLVAGTTYYAINRSATTIAVATSLGNAIANGGLNLTTVGSGTNSLFASDQITVADALSFYTGTPVQVANTGGALPVPLVGSTTYYAIYVDATHFKLATSLANALQGISINFTVGSSGINTATIIYNTALSNGQGIGEFSHIQTVGELAPHVHRQYISFQDFGNIGGGGTPFGTSNVGSTTLTINAQDNTGAFSAQSVPMNNVQPSFYTNCFLKL